MVIINRKKLGDTLVDIGKITRDQLDRALQEHSRTKERLGKVIVDLGFLREEEITETLSNQFGISVFDWDNSQVDTSLLSLIPREVARKYELMPVSKVENVLTVVMVDPLDIYAIDEVIRITRCEVDVRLSSHSYMKRILDKYYGESLLIEDDLEDIKKEEHLEQVNEKRSVKELMDIAEDAPVIRLVNNLITQAIRDSASDIHIEPDEKEVRIRFRLDGMLREIPSLPKKMQLPVISRVKIMSGIDIANMRTPQDGRFDIKIKGKDIGFRVSTFPTLYGENVVLRLLDKSKALYGIDKLGLRMEDQKRLEEIARKPYGLILATGPTGSGKSTSLYAILNLINSVEKNIVTLEDPIEYTVKMVRQAQINPRAGLTFETGLRSILRQDPDIIMVGEIRDKNTATIAIQAALTGHMVFSTLHTNDAPSAITRLIDMGMEPFLVASSVTAIFAQRLVRTLCNHCKEPYNPSSELLKTLGIKDVKDRVIYQKKGCIHCRYTGYDGRIGIFELFTMNEEIRQLTVKRTASDLINKAAQNNGMQDMKTDVFDKVLNGITTLEEAVRVIQVE
ncbi:MAG: ATPase, T2SS/T4P/T4SS family [bacterium]